MGKPNISTSNYILSERCRRMEMLSYFIAGLKIKWLICLPKHFLLTGSNFSQG
jgi:hypothetical protein